MWTSIFKAKGELDKMKKIIFMVILFSLIGCAKITNKQIVEQINVCKEAKLDYIIQVNEFKFGHVICVKPRDK